MSNFREMAPERLFKKISDFSNMNILYIILKHVVWRFRIYNYFQFRDFINTLRNFAKSVFAHIFATFEYFAKVIIYWKSPDHVLQNMICSYFIIK